MLNSLLKGFSGENDEQATSGTRGADSYTERLRKITDLFPIGAKVNYFPEFLEDILLETIVLGYEVNNRPVYSRDHVSEGENGLEFYLQSTGDTIEAMDIGSFTFIIPDTSSTTRLDYDSIAKIGRGGQFMRGNDISLVGTGAQGGVPILDTTVNRKSKIREGVYQNYEVVILDPKFDSLSTKENRHQSRLHMSLPCTLFTAQDEQSKHQCTMIDCSELCVGIALPEPAENHEALTQGTLVNLNLPLPAQDKTFDLTGEILAVRPNHTLLVELQGIMKQSTTEPLQLVDRLDLRAALVHSNSDQRKVVHIDDRRGQRQY